MSPDVVRRVKLELPKLDGERQSLFISPNSPNAKWIFRDTLNAESSRRLLPWKTNLWLLDPSTGGLLKHSPLHNTGSGYSFAIHGNKIAMAESGWVKLFDADTHRERDFQIGAGDIIRFSSEGSLLVCTDSSHQKLINIDWETATHTQQSLNFRILSFNFISDDVMLIHDGNLAKRWKWNGREFSSISPGIAVAGNVMPVPFRKHRSGLLQLLAAFEADWPIHLKPWLAWLESKNIPVSKWYPKIKQGRWYLVDEHDQVVSEVNEPLFDSKIRIYDQFAVEFLPGTNGSKSILFWNTTPIWPNAMALGMMVYLMLYVAARCIRRN
jgi:hypothetical protein